MNTNLRIMGVAAAASIALAGCSTMSGTGYGGGYGAMPAPSSAACYDCGVVTRIDQIGTGSQRSGVTGAVVGGLVGAAAGRTLANDSSKGRQNTATLAGAVAGAATGAAIDRNIGNGGTYNVYVRMDDGRTTMITQGGLGGVREGSRVRVYNGRVTTY